MEKKSLLNVNHRQGFFLLCVIWLRILYLNTEIQGFIQIFLLIFQKYKRQHSESGALIEMMNIAGFIFLLT